MSGGRDKPAKNAKKKSILLMFQNNFYITPGGRSGPHNHNGFAREPDPGLL